MKLNRLLSGHCQIGFLQILVFYVSWFLVLNIETTLINNVWSGNSICAYYLREPFRLTSSLLSHLKLINKLIKLCIFVIRKMLTSAHCSSQYWLRWVPILLLRIKRFSGSQLKFRVCQLIYLMKFVVSVFFVVPSTQFWTFGYFFEIRRRRYRRFFLKRLVDFQPILFLGIYFCRK
jgi:hypothetical protein